MYVVEELPLKTVTTYNWRLPHVSEKEIVLKLYFTLQKFVFKMTIGGGNYGFYLESGI